MTARDQWVWVFEIGTRAALYAETTPRDLRWFRNLCTKGQFLRQIDSDQRPVMWWRIRRRARQVHTEAELLDALREGTVFWW